METFLIGLFILAAGGFLYGAFCERTFSPDDRKTPAVAINDGVDFVPMKKWKNSLIQLLNIAGTGPIIGPIQGILFGPVAFILIPVGCVLGGAMHDYFCGMISMRERGAQMPVLVNKYLGGGMYRLYSIVIGIMLLLLGAVFIYTPGDLVVRLLNRDVSAPSPTLWIVYGLIFAYYIVAALFPIDKVIGRIYPVFGGLLLLSTLGVLVGVFTGGYRLDNLSLLNWAGTRPGGAALMPGFFVTVACGIVSGFHSTQTTILSRTVRHEREGRTTFYGMMILEGVVAMAWAAAAMGIYNKTGVGTVSAPEVIGMVANDLFGSVAGFAVILGVIILPLTSGDTSLRSLRLMVAEFLRFDQKPLKNRAILTAALFVPVTLILFYAKSSVDGFQSLWKYFAWSNQTITLFAFSLITVYLAMRRKNHLIALVPGGFYAFVVSSYILTARIGLNLPYSVAYVLAAALTVAYVVATLGCAHRMVRRLQGEQIRCE